jgi:hypothetical protein
MGFRGSLSRALVAAAVVVIPLAGGQANSAIRAPGGMFAVSPTYYMQPETEKYPPMAAPLQEVPGSDRAPSCRSIRYNGNAGYIGVQVDPYSNYLQWGIYMYDKNEESGNWVVDVYINWKRVDAKRQNYAPHGSLPPSVAKPGSFFSIEATLQTSQNSYRNVKNGCEVPPHGSG